MPRLVTSFDRVVLAAVARDVTALVGSRVVRVTQPAAEEVALAVRGLCVTASILSSFDPRWARIRRAHALAALLSSSDAPLAAALLASVLGLSPPLAAEVAVRAGLDPAAPARPQAGGAARLWDALQDLVATVTRAAFAPVVFYDGNDPVGFAPFLFVSLGRLRPVPASSMSEAVEIVLSRFGAAARIEEERAALLAVV